MVIDFLADIYTFESLLCLISANLIRLWENPHLLPFLWPGLLCPPGHGIEFGFEPGNLTWGGFFRDVFFYVCSIEIVIEVDKVGPSVALRAVMCEMSLLPTIEACIIGWVGVAWPLIASSLWKHLCHMSSHCSPSSVSSPIRCSSLVEIHGYWLVCHPPRGIGEIERACQQSLSLSLSLAISLWEKGVTGLILKVSECSAPEVPKGLPGLS